MSHAATQLPRLKVSQTTQDVLRQHQDALEVLRTAFNALEAKQRQQANALIALAEEDRAHAKAITGLRVACLWFARTFTGRLKFLLTGH